MTSDDDYGDDRRWCFECGQIDCRCDDCPTCKGRGTVNPLTAPPDFFCVGTTDCPHCDGRGTM
jgi:hypothetical protein